VGSENSDEDMGNYIKATDAIRETFDCSVLVVHHCGINDSRPRGHTSLTGAADARLAVTRDVAKNILVNVEFMKDGEGSGTIVSTLESFEVGADADGEPITSCVVLEAEEQPEAVREAKLTRNQQTYLSILKANEPIKQDELNDKLRDAGIGVKRKADLVDIRLALQGKGLIYEGMNGWSSAA
jgi:hypothetical protein